ncbi:hypothetical protein [Cardinium endosymbiont of Tipula unca]|uniref:hypothetical protein n=1 Tax=Cardinium endosymbiont of Tipula unca TaxID=3066216 RepID=UPI0030D4E8CD
MLFCSIKGANRGYIQVLLATSRNRIYFRRRSIVLLTHDGYHNDSGCFLTQEMDLFDNYQECHEWCRAIRKCLCWEKIHLERRCL